jgi:hypothetical protein
MFGKDKNTKQIKKEKKKRGMKWLLFVLDDR